MKKWNLGAWFLGVLRVMAWFKFLRGTPFDPFRNQHRKAEQRLPAEYEGRMGELLAALTPENHALAVEIASIPEHVRGFGLVKEQQLEAARARELELLDAFRTAR